MHYDVIIIGGSVAGSTCARELSRSDLKVGVIEKRAHLGIPKKCGEGLSLSVFDEFGIEKKEGYIAAHITHANLIAPNGHKLVFDLSHDPKVVLQRHVFEEGLRSDAEKGGVEYCMSSVVKEVLPREGGGYEIISSVVGEDVKKEDSCDVLILAEGANSFFAKKLGFSYDEEKKDMDVAIQYDLDHVKCEPDAMYLYYGSKVATGGYAWIFPKGKLCNVGVGINPGFTQKSPKFFLEGFIDEHPEMFSTSENHGRSGGIIPLKYTRELVKGTAMIIGDTGRTVNAIHGGGIAFAMRSAKCCSNIVLDTFASGEISEQKLKEYETNWFATHGKKSIMLYRAKQFFDKLDDEGLNALFTSLTSQEIDLLYRGSFREKLGLITKKVPRLLTLAQKFFMN